MVNKKLLPLLLICIAVAVAVITDIATTSAAPIAADATVDCHTVIIRLKPCLGYVLGAGIVPSVCCSGIKSLFIVAHTKADHQSICNCLKSRYASATREQISRAARIPGICKTKVPAKISKDVDCSKIN
ncbi:non-specific lipid-transfer protein 1-like [Nicotiana tabacum]|uniref:Non-specific lipid-transfer protein n=1 Tax=Nicotiana tabacum TaxID=4097 RepID=A0A1S3WZI7_TOBAC|nr:PREDICTED: non-specific lipid-transfer protein 1-like [Nicotiana tabacum]